jgi:azurin
MQKHVIYILLAMCGLVCAGCGNKSQESSAEAPMPKQASGPTDAEIPVNVVDKVQEVKMTGDDSMHYNGDRFTVVAGQPVRVDLTNIGSKPATEMEHDFVLLKPGTDAMLFNLTCAMAKSDGFLPPAQLDKVITHTAFAGPGQTVTITFTAPAPGQYTFLCNYPGHYAAGMHGTMTSAPATGPAATKEAAPAASTSAPATKETAPAASTSAAATR